MDSSSLHFSNRRKKPPRNFVSNTTRTKKFQNSFIQRPPTNRSQLKNFDTNLLIPYQIKAPTCSKKQIKFFPIAFSTIGQWPNKNICQKQSKKNSPLGECRNPDRNHMTPYCICSCRGGNNTIPPKVTPPSDQSITQQISPENTSNGQNTQRKSHCQRNSRSPYFKFTSIIRPVENSNQYTKTISTSLTCYCHQNQMTISCTASRSPPRQFQNSIFTIISCQKRPSQQTQTSQKQTSPCKGQSRMSTPRTAHVLNIRRRMDNNSSTLKLQCFKTCMSHQMIHCQPIMTQGKSNNHVAQLTTSTVCNYTLYIILNESHSPPHQTSDCSNPQQKSTCIETTFPNSICTCNQKNTCCHKSCSMDKSGNGCWTLHPIPKPHVQANLGTFSQSSTLLTKTNPICIICRSPCPIQQRGISGSQIPPTKKQSKKLNSITYTVNKHCFLCSFSPTQTMKPKTNQQIATNSNHFPANHECQQIICCYLQQHRSSKQTQITLKTRKMRVILHIAQTVNMNTKANSTNCNHHRSTLCIKTQKPINCNCMSIKPISQRKNDSGTHRPNFIKNKITKKSTSTQSKNGNTSTTTSTQPSTSLASQGTPQKRRENSIQIHFFCRKKVSLFLKKEKNET